MNINSRQGDPFHPARSRWLPALCILLIIGALFPGNAQQTSSAAIDAASQPVSTSHLQDVIDQPRRTNIPYFNSDDVPWDQSAIFWFGQNQLGVPGLNYVDVRLAYTPQALRILVVVVDYNLWYKVDPQPADDLSQFDAVALYVDTNHDRASLPQTDDYKFLIGARHSPNSDAPQYRRQARGTGSGWNNQWVSSWTDFSSMQWSCNPGPNSNTCGIDYGWIASFAIPWAALGRASPPEAGTLWGLGVELFDRDNQPPAGYLVPEYWPETVNPSSPATWGDLHFGYADYQPPQAVQRGTTMIRASSTTDNTVEDSWNGGGGTCSSGHEGGSEINHGDHANLFVGAETAPTHFPCFNKSYLRFSLNSVPANKVIMDATLTLHHWGNAGAAGQAQPSWVSLFSIVDPWVEMTIHWNNAPMAYENVSAAWIYPLLQFPGWPGTAYSWDATKAVAQAYAQGLPVNLAIYGSDTEQHSSKYLTSSETGDWNIAGRPQLTIIWGDPLATVSKTAFPILATDGDPIAYTLSWLGTNQALELTDTLPAGLSAPSLLTASSGTVNYDPGEHEITWTGAPGSGVPVTITYSAIVEVSGPTSLKNTAVLASQSGSTTDTATVYIDFLSAYLPLARK